MVVTHKQHENGEKPGMSLLRKERARDYRGLRTVVGCHISMLSSVPCHTWWRTAEE